MTSTVPDRRLMHEHANSLADLVAQLEASLGIKSIMTPWSEVDAVFASGKTEESLQQARELMERHHYSGVPVIHHGAIAGVFMRRELDAIPQYERARSTLFVDTDATLLTSLDHMWKENHIAVAVGTADDPQGWVTYADFSKRPFRVLLFAIMAEAEYLIALAFDRAHPDNSWVDLLDPEPQSEVRERMNGAEHWDSVMPATTYADLGHLVHAVDRSDDVKDLLHPVNLDRLRMLPDLRNRVAHAVKPVIAGPKQIKVVAKQVEQVLGWIHIWEERLNGSAQFQEDESKRQVVS